MRTPKIIFSIKTTSPETKSKFIVREILGAFDTRLFLEEKCGLQISEQKLLKMKEETTFTINNQDYKNYLSKRFIIQDFEATTKTNNNEMVEPHIIINRIN